MCVFLRINMFKDQNFVDFVKMYIYRIISSNGYKCHETLIHVFLQEYSY